MKKSDIPIIKHISDFLEYIEVEKGLSPITSKNYHNFLSVFINWLKANNLINLKPHELSTDHIWNYRLYLSRKKDGDQFIKKTTQSYYLIALRALLNYFADQDIVSLPAEKIKLPKLTDKDKKIKFLKVEQIERLFATPDISTVIGLRDRAILEAVSYTHLTLPTIYSV